MYRFTSSLSREVHVERGSTVSTESHHARRVLEEKFNSIITNFVSMEKFANMVSDLSLAWATFVVLGPFGEYINSLDFWLLSAVVLINGLRFIARVQELKWQNQSELRTIEDGIDDNYEDDGQVEMITGLSMINRMFRCMLWFSTTVKR